MRNVEAVLGGADAVFGDPIPLDLGKRGLRDMVWSERHRAMLLIAGPSGETGSFALYRWGAGPPSPLPWTVPLPARFHPETVVAIPEFERHPRLERRWRSACVNERRRMQEG